MSRVKNITRNAVFAFFKFALQIILQFAVRTAFIFTLGSRYLGLDSLFINIVYVLSIAELGIGAAIGYSMYKPAADGDIEKLKSLDALFRKVYRCLMVIILVIGLAIMPFLHLLVNDVVLREEGINTYIVFIAFLVTTLISYLGAHKRTLLFVHQRNDILSKISSLCMILTRGVQISILFVTHLFLKEYTYYIYIATMPLGALAENLLVLFVASRLFPKVTGEAQPIDSITKKTILKNVIALSFHKISNVIMFAIGNILISLYFGLVVLGISANYILIFSSVLLIVEIFAASVQGSIGNMIASDTIENNYKIFKMLNMVFNMLVGFCTICMLCLFQPFISFWVNDAWLLSVAFVISVVLRFYFTQITQIVFIYRTCSGLMWNDRWVPIITVPLSIVLSILFINLFGLPGVFLGTAVAFALIAVWVTPYIIHKHYFKKPVRGHYLNFITFTLITAIAAAISFYICQLLPGGFWFLCVRGFICCTVVGVIYLAIFGWTKEFRLMICYTKRILKRRIIKSKN